MVSPMRSTAPPINAGSTTVSRIGGWPSDAPSAAAIRSSCSRIDRGGRGQADADLALQLLEHSSGLAADRPQAVETAVPRDDLEEIQQQAGNLRGEDAIEDDGLLLGADQERGEDRLELGELGKDLAHDGVQFVEHGERRPRMFRGGHQGAGVDLADLLPAHVGREAGRVVGVAGNDVSRFGHGTPSPNRGIFR